MTDFTDPSEASLRLSNAERDEAVSALEAHAHDGRLTDPELQARVAAARAASTRGDIAPLFSDLPTRAAAPNTSQRGRPDTRTRSTLLYLTPFIALVLFFLTGLVWGFQFSWLWFLLVPVVYLLTHGVDGGSGDDRDRNHDRDRNRERN